MVEIDGLSSGWSGLKALLVGSSWVVLRFVFLVDNPDVVLIDASDS